MFALLGCKSYIATVYIVMLLTGRHSQMLIVFYPTLDVVTKCDDGNSWTLYVQFRSVYNLCMTVNQSSFNPILICDGNCDGNTKFHLSR